MAIFSTSRRLVWRLESVAVFEEMGPSLAFCKACCDRNNVREAGRPWPTRRKGPTLCTCGGRRSTGQRRWKSPAPADLVCALLVSALLLTFGPNAGPPNQGYYSYELGTWHIVALNSNLTDEAWSEQERWLRADLAAHRTRCTLAYWHRPVFSSGRHGNDPHMHPIWPVLYEFGVDVVVNGHDHDYERFAPQNPDGEADAKRGIREFVVGTGGAGLYEFRTIRANSEVRNNTTWGVLKLTLHATSYDWEFIPVAGGAFHDAGSAACVQ